jgi:hypothetical protein
MLIVRFAQEVAEVPRRLRRGRAVLNHSCIYSDKLP